MLFATLAQPPARDSAAAHRLWLAALDAEAMLQTDSALALLASARDADPAFFLAQHEYVRLRWTRGELWALRRLYARPDPRGGAVSKCLALAIAAIPSSSGGFQANVEPLGQLAALERRGDPSGCAATYVVWLRTLFTPFKPANPVTLAYARRATELAPDVVGNWESLAEILRAGGKEAEAETALREGARLVQHPYPREQLYAHLINDRLERGDSAPAMRLATVLRAAAARDGRPGSRLWGDAWARSTPAADSEYVRLSAAAGDGPTWVNALLGLGGHRMDVGDPAGALPAFDAAVALADSLGRPWYQLRARIGRGRALAKLGRSADAERDLRQALRAGAAAPDVYFLAEAWHNLAHVYEGEGRWTAAAAAADSFVALTAPMRFDDHRMMSLHDAGVIRWKAGWHAAANADFLAMVAVIDDEQSNFYWAGEYFERIGDLARALAYYGAGTRRYRSDPQSFAGLARVYEALGQDSSAEGAARAHDAMIEEWRPTEGPMLPVLLARHGRGLAALALDRGWAVRQLGKGNVEGAAIATGKLAERLLTMGHADSAAVEAVRAESLAASLHLTDELIRAETLRGRALFALGDHPTALRTLETAAALAAAHPTADGVLATQLALGDALAAAGRPQASLAAYDRAARTVERITVGLRDDVDRAGYRERHLRSFDGALRVLLGAAAPPLSASDAALLWTERRKAAALALATAGAAHGPAPLERVELQRRLGPREALVDYLVTDSLVAALVLTDHAATVVRLPTTRESMARLVERLRRPLVTTFAGRLDLARAPYDLALAQALYAALIRPLEPALAGRDRWFIVPDGPLHALPFEALVTRLPPTEHPGYDAAQYLLDQALVTYLPSAQFLAPPGDRARRLADARVLAVAGDAPGGAREVAAVRAAFSPARVRVLSQGDASETAIRAAGPRYAIVHFATHSEANNADPLASHLRLAPDGANDGYFHVNEIARTRWRTRLVVLSACETFGGRLYEGEGLMGLARAFLASGAEAVVATQWPVGASSADVMGVFYRRLAAGSAPDAALRDAQLALRRNPATSHPFYWGGFALVRGRGP